MGCTMNLARLLFQQGDVRSAIQELTHAAEENPDSMDINKFLVLLLAKEGDKDAALKHLESFAIRHNIYDFAPEFPDQRPATHGRAFIQAKMVPSVMRFRLLRRGRPRRRSSRSKMLRQTRTSMPKHTANLP